MLKDRVRLRPSLEECADSGDVGPPTQIVAAPQC